MLGMHGRTDTENECGDRHLVVIGTGAQSVLGFMRPGTAAPPRRCCSRTLLC